MTPISPPPRIVLASGSEARRTLLSRLGLDFTVIAPDVDETPLPDETPQALARRLAELKARAVVSAASDALVIGSDQVASLDGKILSKPGGHEAAAAQLQAASGRRMKFVTSVCVLDATTGESQTDLEWYWVSFRRLTLEQINEYLRRERPYDCAGAFKSEGLGVALFSRLDGDDPTALIGLPLIRLTRMLERAGVAVL